MAVNYAFTRSPVDLPHLTPRNSHQLTADDVQHVQGHGHGVIQDVLGSFGIGRDALTRMSFRGHEDEDELVAAAQQEYMRMQAPKTRKKSRQDLEALDEKVAQVDSSESDYIERLSRLIRKYRIPLPSVTVEYRDLNITTQALKGSAAAPTVGSSFANLFRSMACMSAATVEHKILTNLNGVLLPGRTTLVLGPPSSGKSSFLKALCGRMVKTSELDVQADVKYNGHTFKEFNVTRTSGFVGQVDTHIPSLSVLETLEFAQTCQQGHTPEQFNLIQAIEAEAKKSGLDRTSLRTGIAWSADNDDEAKVFMDLLSEMKESRGINVMMAMRALGIAHTKDTPVGDAMLRGVSGGERKRVTLAEMLVGGKIALFLDEISTGLDSATVYSVVQQLCRICRTFKLTLAISLLQPSPEVYGLFDDLILMSHGHIVWHGPVGEVVPFFTSQGFVCPPRKDVPSFLQEVVTESGQLDYASDELLARKGFKGRNFPDGRKKFLIPPEELVSAFWQCPAGVTMQGLLDKPYDKTRSHPAALKHGNYALSSLEALWVVCSMQMLHQMKDMGICYGRMMQSLVVALLVGGLFWQPGPTAANTSIYFGAAFLMVMFISMNSMIGLTTGLATKPVWLKHRAALFYPAWAHALAATVVEIPVQVAETFLWAVVTYFMIGFYGDAGYFFIHYLVLVGVAVCFGAVFRCIAHLCPDLVSASSFGGLMLLILSVMSGFTIPRQNVPDWWIWAYWMSPYAWAMRSVVVNEMTSPNWSYPYPQDPLLKTGDVALLSFGFYTERHWIWSGIGFLFGMTLVLVAVSTWALAYLNGPTAAAAVADEDELEEARLEAEKRRTALVVKRQAQEQEMMKIQASNEHTTIQVAADNGASASIPFEPCTVVWRDLRYFVPNPGYKKGTDLPAKLELLKGITGYAEPGQLTALMGGSGAGKTTLMDCIAGRKTVGEITGDIIVNGHPKVQATWSRVMGYVEQMDIHTAAQTVIEALLFSARLRLPKETPMDKVRAYVDEVMDLVDLTEIMFSVVGYPGQTGLSVEQRKRLTIGVELVANPAVMFMDEPTSGLDARAASIVMRTVRNVGNSNRAVLVTIHQPSIEIFEAFDNLLLLQRGGRITYFGPLGKESCNLVAYLEAVPGCQKMQLGFNPATWMLEVTGGAVSVTAKAVEVNWPDLYQLSELAAQNNCYAEDLIRRDNSTKQPLAVASTYAAPFGMQCRALWDKFWYAYWRMPSYNYVRFIMTIASAIVYGSIYYGIADFGPTVTLGTVQSVGGVIYLAISFLGMSNMMSVMPLVGLERVVYYREQAASYYNPWGYGLMLNMVELPYQFVQVCVFVCIMYPLLFFVRDAAHFFFFLCMTLLSLMFYVSFGMALMYVSPSQDLAMVMGAGFNFLFSIFNGYVIPYPSMAKGFQWLNRVSPTTWVIYGLVSDQLGGLNLPMTQVPGATPGEEPTVAQYIEATWGYLYSFRGWTLLILLAYVLLLRVVAILALRYINFLKR